MIRKIMRITFKGIFKLVLVLCVILFATQTYAPIYNFPAARPFYGDSIYNPYHDVDFSKEFLKANLHGHASKDGAPFEKMFDYTPGQYSRIYDSAGYDIALITDHQFINPESPVRSYEHGYNANNCHINSYGATEVWRGDIPLMLMGKHQMQWQIDKLKERSDIVAINHPSRFRMGMKASDMTLLTGYDLIEMDAKGGGNPYDIVLSTGRYPMMTANDDSHFPDSLWNRQRFQNRYTMIALDKVHTEEELYSALTSGNAYGVQIVAGRTPRGKGTEPIIERISMSGDTLSVAIKDAVDSILFIGQGGKVKLSVKSSSEAQYIFTPEDTYIRTEFHLKNGATVWTNPVARLSALDPFDAPTINWLLSILNSTVWALLTILTIRYGFFRRKRRNKKRKFKKKHRR